MPKLIDLTKSNQESQEIIRDHEAEKNKVEVLNVSPENMGQNQSENSKHSLQKKLESSHIEIRQLRKQLQMVSNKAQLLQEKHAETKSSSQKWQECYLQEKEARKEASEELVALQSQFGSLKDQVLQLNENLATHQKKLDASESTNRELEESLTTAQALVQERTEEIAQYKEKLTAAAQLEKDTIQLKEKYETLLQDFEKQVSSTQEANDAHTNTQEELANLTATLLEKENHITALEGRLTALTQEEITLKENLEKEKKENRENSERLKVAQQHLAKKVKEASMMIEKIDQQKDNMLKLEQKFSQAKVELTEVQTRLDSEVQHERRLDDELKRWEEKYFRLHEKWQEVDGRNRELKALEKKYHEMHALLRRLGSFIGEQAIPDVTSSHEEPDPLPKSEESPVPVAHDEGPTLFDPRKTSLPYKKTLFD